MSGFPQRTGTVPLYKVVAEAVATNWLMGKCGGDTTGTEKRIVELEDKLGGSVILREWDGTSFTIISDRLGYHTIKVMPSLITDFALDLDDNPDMEARTETNLYEWWERKLREEVWT